MFGARESACVRAHPIALAHSSARPLISDAWASRDGSGLRARPEGPPRRIFPRPRRAGLRAGEPTARRAIAGQPQQPQAAGCGPAAPVMNGRRPPLADGGAHVTDGRALGDQTRLPGVRAAPFEADLSSYDNARKLCDEVVKVLGHPDILFSNHGVTGPKIGPHGDIQEVSAETFEEIWRTNAGTGYVVRTAFPLHRITSRDKAISMVLVCSSGDSDAACTEMCATYAREEVGPYRLQFKVGISPG